MIKRKKPLLRKAPIKRSSVPLKRTAIKPGAKKFCDVGEHEVTILFRSRTKTQQSCCSRCINKAISPEKKDLKLKSTISSKPKKESLSEAKEKTQVVVNRWIRNRDTNEDGRFDCRACGGNFPADEMDASHFISVVWSATRFDEMNIHGTCHTCNRFMWGNLSPFGVWLTENYGLELVAELKVRSGMVKKWSREELAQIRDKYKL